MRTIRAKLYCAFGLFLLLLCGVGGYGWHTLGEMTAAYSRLYNDVVIAGVNLGTTQHQAVLAEAGRARIVMLSSFSLALLLGLIASIQISKRLSRAIAENSATLTRIAHGDFSARLQIHSTDELGILAGSMNEVAERMGNLVGNVTKSATELRQISGRVEEVSNEVLDSALDQVKAVEESEAAVKGITASSEILKQRLDSLAIVSEEIASSLSQMVATSEEVAQSVDVQAREVDFVSSSILQMASSIKQSNEHIASLVADAMTTANSISHMDEEIKAVEKNAIGTAEETDKALKDAELGEQTVEATVSSMVEIRAISHDAAEKVRELSDKVAAIDSILKVIDEVSEQTNLLALNAAIIAAQAGEHGKGFAVVADEIKELASRTVISTSEIASVIQTIQEETRLVVDSISTVTHRIDDGVALSRRSGDALSQIVTSVGKALRQVHEIARSTTEHANESQRIKGAIERITTMVEQVSSASTEQAKAAGQISQAAEQMQMLTTHVRTATTEQAATSENINSRTFDNVRMIEEIRELSAKNEALARKVGEEAAIINQAAQHNLQNTTGLNRAMNALIAQSKSLQDELDRLSAS